MVFSACWVMATGSGLFKPSSRGTIARTTDRQQLGLFSGPSVGIYYGMINRAFLAPLVRQS